MSASDHWLDYMPAMPHAKSVPVIFSALDEDERPHGPWQGDRGTVTHVEPGRVMISADSAPDEGSFEAGEAEGWRVDLDDDQGFGYVVRHLLRTTKGRVQTLKAFRCKVANFRELELRLLRGIDITDADRLMVAKSCAKLEAP